MTYLGEMISIGVAFSWTATALLSEFGSKRMGNLTLNVMRMSLALVLSLVLFYLTTGSIVPGGVTGEACGWMLLSGFVGYVIGDFCLFQCYIIIGSRFGQLFMTLAPVSAALMAWVTLGQRLTLMSIIAMLITLSGIGISVLGRGEHHRVSLKLPLNGVLYAVGAAMCQGVGLVLSKIGMDHYEYSPDMPGWLVPFSANFYRCVAGIIGFSILLYLRGEVTHFRSAVRDRKGFAVALATTLFGPFIGVGFSLMAVQYTAAGIASTLMALTPVLILIPYAFIYKQRIKAHEVLGVMVSMVGVALFFLL